MKKYLLIIACLSASTFYCKAEEVSNSDEEVSKLKEEASQNSEKENNKNQEKIPKTKINEETTKLNEGKYNKEEYNKEKSSNIKEEKKEPESNKCEYDSKPDLNICGSASFHSGFSSPNVTYYTGENQPSQIKTPQKSTSKTNKDSSLSRMCAGEAEICFSASGKLQNGWIYQARLVLDAVKEDTGIDKMYITFERNNFGTLQLGNVKGVDSVFLAGGQELIGGTCGVDGALYGDLDYATGVISPIHLSGFSNKATKMSYYTPIMHGFQLGFSITPDTKHHGHNAKNTKSGDSSNGNDFGLFTKGDKDKERPSGRNNMSFGLKHAHKFEKDWKTVFSAVMTMENTQPIETHCYVGDVVAASKESGTKGTDDYKAAVPASEIAKRKIKLKNAFSYQITGTVSYKNFSLGAGYLNNGKSRLPILSEYTDKSTGTELAVLPGGFITAKDGNSGHAWNIGAKYTHGKWAFSTVFHQTARKVTANEKTKGNMFTFATEYLVCPGLKLFLEMDRTSTKSSDYACSIFNLVRDSKTAIKKQSAILFIFGAKISF